MAIYLSMQRVRFSSADSYDKFKMVFADTRNHLKKHPGFLHLTWWEHPEDRTWFNEVSFWASKESLKSWHQDTYHKHAKEWAARGAIMEDIITNFELTSTRLLRVCPCCGNFNDRAYDLAHEQLELATPCQKCGFNFPNLGETASSFSVYQDAPGLPELPPEAPSPHPSRE